MSALTDIGVRARVDAAGRLIAADAPILALQRANGADIGDALVMPGLVRLALLARRLDQRIERPVLLASPDREVRALVRLVPDANGVEIACADWAEAVPATPQILDSALAPLMPRLLRWACDVRLRVVMADAAAGLTLAVDDWLGQPLSALFHLEPGTDGGFPLLDALATQRDFAGQSARLRLASGAWQPVSLTAAAMFDGAQFTGFVGQAAPRLNAETNTDTNGDTDTANDADADTDAANDADDPRPASGGSSTGALGSIDPRRFALRVDGAMRRPLGRIIANAETIAGQFDGPIRADYARYASDIALAGRHLLDLVDDLADLQIVERADFTVASEPVDLAEVARRAAGLLSLKARDRTMQLSAPDADESAPVTAEFRRVLQILLNLVGNAIRYSPEGSQIWLCVADDATHYSLTVADQGAGIAVEDQARLFEKFERLGRSDGGGSGLGLYISRRLARAMGGNISIDSAPGQGARFTLRLPRGDL